MRENRLVTSSCEQLTENTQSNLSLYGLGNAASIGLSLTKAKRLKKAVDTNRGNCPRGASW